MSPSSQNVHELIPGTHKYFIQQGKRDCTDVNKLRDLRWGDYPSEPNIKKKGPYERDYPSEPNEKKKGGPYEREAQGSESEEEVL